MGVPISSLPAASSLTGNEAFPIVQGGSTKRTTLNDIPYTPAGIGAVATTVQAKLWESVSVLDFIPAAEHAGIRAGTSTFNCTAYIQNALNVSKAVFVPAGKYIVSNLSVPSYTRLFGNGYDSIIKSDGSVNHVITLNYVYHCRLDNLRITGNETKTSLCGIYGNGAVWTELENLLIDGNGSHGIQFTDTETPYMGSYPVMCRNVHSRYNAGDGYRQQATSGNNQQNAVFISNSEFQGNTGNGLTLWGTHISVVNSVSEGNTGYGIKLDNGLTSGIYSASNLIIKENYFEANTAGHIHARVGSYGVIEGLTIEENFFSVNTNVLAVGVNYKTVSVDDYDSLVNAIRGLKYRKNTYSIVGSTPTVYADFGNAPNMTSVIEPYAGSIQTDVTTIPFRYTNLGYATFKYIKSLTLPGYWLAKGGSGFTYSSFTKSDPVTVDLSNTYFPLQVPVGSRLLFVSIPVESTVSSYTVFMHIYQRSRDSTAMHTITMYGSGTGSLNQTVVTGALQEYTATEDFIDVANCDMFLRVRVNFSGSGTFYFGNPTVFYVEP